VIDEGAPLELVVAGRACDLFISHNLGPVRHLAHTAAVMYLGKIVEQAPAERLFAAPAHPYTVAPLAEVPVPDPAASQARERLAGDPQSATALQSGFRFRPRCPRAAATCGQIEPTVETSGNGHAVACHFPGA
jgi:oligopeptide/dipeptide ABC transporter ATP-binding protein